MRLVRVVGAAMILLLALAGPASAGIPLAGRSVVVVDSPDPVVAGTNLTYTITAQNIGPSSSTNTTIQTDPIGGAMTFVSFAAPAGWTSMTPAVGGTGTVSATIPSLTVAAGAQVFTLVVHVGASVPGGTILAFGASVSGVEIELDISDNTSSALTTVTAAAATPAATPAASLADAAMPEPAAGSPLAILGFAVLLLAMLSASAVVAVRRVRT